MWFCYSGIVIEEFMDVMELICGPIFKTSSSHCSQRAMQADGDALRGATETRQATTAAAQPHNSRELWELVKSPELSDAGCIIFHSSRRNARILFNCLL